MEATTTAPVQRGALKLRQAADYISVAPITMRRLIARGLIKPNRATRHILVPVAELERFINTRYDNEAGGV